MCNVTVCLCPNSTQRQLAYGMRTAAAAAAAAAAAVAALPGYEPCIAGIYCRVPGGNLEKTKPLRT